MQCLRENVPPFIGESHAIRDLMEFVESVAKSADTPVQLPWNTQSHGSSFVKDCSR